MLEDLEANHRLSQERLRVRRLGIDTHQEPVAYLRADSAVCRSEGFTAQSRIYVSVNSHGVIATLNVVHGDLVSAGEVGLSEAAWRLLSPHEGDLAAFSHPSPVESFSALRAKIYGHELTGGDLNAIIRDIVGGRYADVHLAAFITACAGDHMSLPEITELTRAMVLAGRQLTWPRAPVLDKHSVGGLPGNRTTPIVVAIVAANGLCMPKTSSRAITSPAGTADTMETLAPVNLTLEQMRSVVEREGACLVWGGSADLSPADDVLIRVERALDLDSEGQLVASVLSKKLAAGASHVVLDMPVGPTAKVRSPDAAAKLSRIFEGVAQGVGLTVRTVLSDGTQPVGRGIGPALEAQDVLAVLRCDPGAPQDLRERAAVLAGHLLEIGGKSALGQGKTLALSTLDDGRAWQKFCAICEAQGGMRKPGVAPHTYTIVSGKRRMIAGADNRKLARIAKLAGAPKSPEAGVLMQVRVGQTVEKGQPLYTIHAQTPGELSYALEYARHNSVFMTVEEQV
ncbi:MAG: thymidine phosphorylase family protein [Planctomycetaceae bacterium]|nr:putative thymidine phosphorylase [Planctomycetota bacterium]MCQ3950343.1 thymidine phosphorylase [Planctomycetota bacterium]NUO15751.1 thymidine phosphorylase family protein [Planctomycetaceae bacterium]GIK53942.1 MAG: putative thymidine phosphorylase [Planctomycetota bacterium]